jgi:hypothetical protein
VYSQKIEGVTPRIQTLSQGLDGDIQTLRSQETRENARFDTGGPQMKGKMKKGTGRMNADMEQNLLEDPSPPMDISQLGPILNFKVFREDEEATKILQLIALERSYIKCILVVPLLAICTALIFLLFLFWYPNLRKKFFYNETTLDKATHLFV